MGRFRPLFCLFSSFQHYTIQIDKSVDGVLGTRTRGGRMEGAAMAIPLILKIC